MEAETGAGGGGGVGGGLAGGGGAAAPPAAVEVGKRFEIKKWSAVALWSWG